MIFFNTKKAKNASRRREMYFILRKKGLPHKSLMKKIQSLEDEGVSTRNFKWDGWDPLEFDEAFLQQKKMREKAAIEDEKEAKMTEKFITLERREFEEAEKRRAEEDAEPDAFVSDKEQDQSCKF